MGRNGGGGGRTSSNLPTLVIQKRGYRLVPTWWSGALAWPQCEFCQGSEGSEGHDVDRAWQLAVLLWHG